ncbi:glycine zipper 2TM domain-containing protein [Sphingomonadaceae bacterium G21617-S1]|jgi:hypothetical protein|uniref:glycine zipper 2TM domain-containing protein n=1 Tax=Rhizorhabdus sp. TaxID=1968843 RepID=UPI0022BCDA74|nr:glycine zipper 2TM domain-containing protein [Rhizorhabdus sp.]MCZ4342413.1 glycine zipper 2TM domain-containing protein [Sphingomonadaceae bacterium G21617-S1]
MRRFIIAAALAATVMPSIPAMAQQGWSQHDRREQRRDDRADRRDDRQDRRAERRDDRRDARRDAWRNYSRYDYNRPDPRYGNRYDAARYYRNDASYRERRLTRNDRIYRGNDGRYYCRREDGTTGLIIGALAGGLLGNQLANGRSTTLITILGAGGGAAIGRSIDRGDARCR